LQTRCKPVAEPLQNGGCRLAADPGIIQNLETRAQREISI
jgi:hypothetical protein